VVTCAHLAAVYLCADADREGHPELAAAFTRSAMASGLRPGVTLGPCGGLGRPPRPG